MKNTKITKIISVLMSTLLIAAMLTAVGVSASAATPDEAALSYYDIAVTEYIDDAKSAVPSLVSVSTDKVSADSGEAITVTVDEEATEPSDPDYYSELPPVSGPDISCDHDGSGKVDYKDKLMDINGDGYFDIMNTDEGFIWIKNVTYTAVPDGADFVRWELDGDYELISGSLTDPVIVVRPKSIRLSGTAIFADSPALAHKPAEKPEATPDQKPSPPLR